MFSAGSIRQETWHALSVHFPIALLPVATIALLVSFFIARSRRSWQMAGFLLLLAGTSMAWVSNYTGNIADGIVARKICDPTILKDHEIAGQTMTWIFTMTALLYLVLMTTLIKARLRTFGYYVVLILLVIGNGYLVYTGHIGATLVYDQGAGVKNHVVDCE